MLVLESEDGWDWYLLLTCFVAQVECDEVNEDGGKDLDDCCRYQG